MDTEHGDLLRWLQIEFSKTVQWVTEDSGAEILPGELWEVALGSVGSSDTFVGRAH